MRILYLDIDALRPDHLGCYGYHRNTSPNIDRIAKKAVRFENCHASDSPCMPSRTALFSGRFGIHTGAVCHAGTAAEPFVEGVERSFQSKLGQTCWMASLRLAGMKTASISSFGERHSAWWWCAGFQEIQNCGQNGNESADEVTSEALSWLDRHADGENWFLHVNFWDAHTPYRVPESYGDPFRDSPLPTWLSEEVRARHWKRCGPQGARERGNLQGTDDHQGRYPRQPHSISSMEEVRRMFDGYDTAIRYVDDHIGKLLEALDAAGVLEDTAIIISADHGENLGELNLYGCHQFADQITTRVPMILSWPGLTPGGQVDSSLRYHFDIAATVIELAGGTVPRNWDGQSFAQALREGGSAGRDHLVLSHAQGSCQRSIRFRHDGSEYLCIRTYHDGLHGLPEVMLFDVQQDPYEQTDLAGERPAVVTVALRLLEQWRTSALAGAPHSVDPMQTVLDEGGPPHTRSWWPAYYQRLLETDRAAWAEELLAKHPIANHNTTDPRRP
jgi:choline-sulfatase